MGVEERLKGLLRLVAAFSHPNLVKSALGLRLETLGELVQHVSRLVHPTALMACLAVDFGERLPQAQSPIADGELGTDLQPLVLEPRQEFQPAVLRLPEAVLDGHELLGALLGHSDDDEQAFARLFPTHIEVHPIGPPIHVALA